MEGIMETVSGDRTCPVCRGIVPGGVVIREKHGRRRRYFDTRECAIEWMSRQAGVEFTEWGQVKNNFEQVIKR